MKNIDDLIRVLSYTKEGIKKAAAAKDATLFNDFATVYHSFFGSSPNDCNGCPGGFESSFTEAEQFYKNYLINPKIMETTTCQFKVKGGGSLNYGSAVYTDKNLTDEIVLRMIKENPKRKGHFENLPKDIDKMLEGVKTKAEILEEKKKSREAPTTVKVEDGKIEVKEVSQEKKKK